MKDLLNALVELLKVKSLITLSVVGVLVFLTVKGNVDISVFMGIASSVITYYFTRNNNLVNKETPPVIEEKQEKQEKQNKEGKEQNEKPR